MTVLSIPVPGATLHTVDEGAGPPIVLLHAGIADLRAWDAMVPHLVAAGYRVIRFDRRGFGRTVAEDVAFSNRADVIAVMDACGVGRAAVVGNSAGGQITFDTAIEFPDRVVAAIGVGAGLGGFDGGATPEELELFELGEALEEAEPVDADEIADFDVRFWVDGPGQPTDRVPVRDPRSRSRDGPGRTTRLAWSMASRHRSSRGPRTGWPSWSARSSPSPARSTPPSARSPPATSRRPRPNARALIWDDVAHMIGMEQPKRLADAIVEFLAPLPRWS